MSKVLFIGDPHLDTRTPISRLDEYSETTLTKLRKVLEIALRENVEHVVMTGDVFDKYEVTITYLNRVMQVLEEFKQNNINVYSIIGNHDLPHNNKKYFPQTPLYSLFQSNLVKHFTKLEINDIITIYGIDFTEMDTLAAIKADISNEKKRAILIMHYATDNTIPNESIPREQLTEFELVVSGHDHMYYPHSELDKPVVLRPGSMVRRTKDQYNLTRDPLVHIYDLDTRVITEVSLEARPAQEVFKAEAIFGGVESFDPSTFGKIFDEMYFKKESADIESMINDLPIDITTETRKELRQHFKSAGVIK